MYLKKGTKLWHSLKSGPETRDPRPMTRDPDPETGDPVTLRHGTVRYGTLRPEILGPNTKFIAIKAFSPIKYATYINGPLYHRI